MRSLVIVALGVACVAWAFAGTRFMRVLWVSTRQLVRYTVVAGGIYLLCTNAGIWTTATRSVTSMRDGVDVLRTVIVRLLTIQMPAAST